MKTEIYNESLQHCPFLTTVSRQQVGTQTCCCEKDHEDHHFYFLRV